MRLIPNARRTAIKAYSMWANYLGILCLVAPELIFAVSQTDTNPRFWWVMGLALIVAGIVGRLVDQGVARSPALVGLFGLLLAMTAAPFRLDAMSEPLPAPPVAAPSEAETMRVLVPLVAKWEGKENVAYLDRIASPPVWTVCHGETRGVEQGDIYTDAQCAAMLQKGLVTYRNGLHEHFTDTTKGERLTPERDAAYVSLAYNVGIAGAGRSTATKRLNSGDVAGGCRAIGWWNRAGNRVVRGLVNRRADEVALCLKGVS